MIVNLPSVYSGDESIESMNSAVGGGFIECNKSKQVYWYFNKIAFEQFMKYNEFDYHIRSHNPCEDGYGACFDNKCLTVYSCSKSGDASSHIGFIQINDTRKTIRFMKFAYNDSSSYSRLNTK